MSAFENAPATRFFVVSVFTLSILFGESNDITFDVDRILSGQIWRVISSPFIFKEMAQTCVGLIILYNCRQFERQIGIAKFTAFVVVSYAISVGLQIAIVLLFQLAGIVIIPSPGPYFLIFSLLMLFYAHVPKLQSSQFAIFGINFSEKSWIYLLAAQLVFSDRLNSLTAASVGMIIGVIYDRNRFGIQQCRLPQPIQNVFRSSSALIGSMFGRPAIVGGGATAGIDTNAAPGIGLRSLLSGMGGNRGNQYQRVQGQDQDDDSSWDRDLQSYGGTGRGGFGNGTPPAAQPPSEEAITNLMGLGFDRPTVIRALQNSSNNVEAAANFLFR